jgi:hypothetical protein
VSTSPGSVLGLPVFGDALCTTALRDLNGDGFDDVALVNRSRGNIQMFQGSSLGLATTDNLAVRFDSGDGLAGLGDVDGDGYDDMAVGFAADSGSGCACEGVPGGAAPAILWAVGALLARRRARA